VLSKPVNPKEVLWNFSRYSDERRVGLRQNPHFYELPTLAGNYGGEFRIDPIELETEPNNSHRKTHEKIDQEIDVLTDNSGRVYLETDRQKRAFGNVWALKKAIIFKGSSLSFFPFSRPLTSCQMSVENSRAKNSSGLPLKAYPTYGVLKSLHYLPRLGRLIGVTHHLPRHQRLPQHY
jgi:hypothetical protein